MGKNISYGRQWIDQRDIDEVTKVLKSDFLTQGPYVEKFEQALCRYTGAKYCVAVSNGTAALHLAVLALQIKPGAQGITSPNTFLATANAFIYGGLTPRFVDIDPQTFNLDLGELKKSLNKQTKLIIPVHFAGQPVDMRKVKSIIKGRELFVIEDASHAIGSKYADGSRIGSCRYSTMTTFSFHPVKTITTGEGGAVMTNDKKIYERLRLLRTHGMTKDASKLAVNPGPWYYEMQTLGFNYRLTDFQAALGVSQLKKLGRFKKRRREIVAQYDRAFANLPNVMAPIEEKGVESAFHLYVLRVDFEALGVSRNFVMTQLKKQGIGTQVHYIPVHLQPYYQNCFGYKPGDFPVCEKYYEQALSLPLYPAMTNRDVAFVIRAVKEIARSKN